MYPSYAIVGSENERTGKPRQHADFAVCSQPEFASRRVVVAQGPGAGLAGRRSPDFAVELGRDEAVAVPDDPGTLRHRRGLRSHPVVGLRAGGHHLGFDRRAEQAVAVFGQRQIGDHQIGEAAPGRRVIDPEGCLNARVRLLRVAAGVEREQAGCLIAGANRLVIGGSSVVDQIRTKPKAAHPDDRASAKGHGKRRRIGVGPRFGAAALATTLATT